MARRAPGRASLAGSQFAFPREALSSDGSPSFLSDRPRSDHRKERNPTDARRALRLARELHRGTEYRNG
jgi:hypothetical protein